MQETTERLIERFIYRLVDPRNNEIFYVGQTYDPRERYYAHIACKSSNTAKDARITELRQLGLRPRFEIIEKIISVEIEPVLEAERKWILFYLEQGEPLTNVIERSKKRVKNLRSLVAEYYELIEQLEDSNLDQVQWNAKKDSLQKYTHMILTKKDSNQ